MIRIVILIIVITLTVGTWYFRYNSIINSFNKYSGDEKIRVSGLINNQPYQKGSKQIIIVGNYLVYVEAYPRYYYGDKVEITGKLDKRVTNIQERKLLLIDPTIIKISNSQENDRQAITGVVRLIFRFRQKLMQQFSKFLPEPQASLVLGILLGVKSELPNDFFEALRNTGTLHVVVASGYNVTVVSGMIAYLASRFISRKISVHFIVVGIVAYTLLAGAEPPVVRAALMSGLSFMAQFLGKQYHGLWALGVVSILMILVSPLMVFDVGFQLSVAATFGILILTPVLVTVFLRFVRRLGRLIIGELAVTLGAQLSVLPILLLNFKQISWLSPITNLIVVLLIPIIMGLGMVLAVVGLVSFTLSKLLALFVWVPLTFFVSVVLWFDRLPFGTLTVSGISWKWVVGYYFLLGLLLFWYSMKKRSGSFVDSY